MELQPCVLKVDILDIWIAAIGLCRIELGLHNCYSCAGQVAVLVGDTYGGWWLHD